jgi:hypothetical protein
MGLGNGDILRVRWADARMPPFRGRHEAPSAELLHQAARGAGEPKIWAPARADSILLSPGASVALLAVSGRRSPALSRPLCRCATIILPGDDAWRLTELSNVVAYVCRPSRHGDSAFMCIFSSVILSEAKACPERNRRDLMPVASSDEILRLAQDDNSGCPRSATKVSATRVFPSAQMGCGNCANPRYVPPCDATPLRCWRKLAGGGKGGKVGNPKIEACRAIPVGRCADAARLRGEME